MPTACTIKLNDRFGKLVVVAYLEKRKGKRWWECLCDCGRTVQRQSGDIKKRLSCGCFRNGTRGTHRMTNTAEFTIWHTMKARVLNPNATGYSRYGGRGITICPEWLESFENFYRDMGPRPSKLHSIDRYPDKNGNYEPGNVRWATYGEQNRNKSNNHELTLNGITRILVEWSEVVGIRADTLLGRTRKGWTDEETLTTPLRGKRLAGK